MADDLEDWEKDDWEKEEFQPPPPKPAVALTEAETAGAAILKAMQEPDMSKFADEDLEEEQPKKPSGPKQKKPEKKVEKARVDVDVPLDDPIAEKLRQQRLIEESDYRAARDLFGEAGVSTEVLDSFLPKTAKDCETFAQQLFDRFIAPHASSKQYKALAKALAKAVAGPLPKDEVKDLETALAGLRADKAKAELAAKKGAPGKKSLNVGRGGASAGLDDYIYDHADDDDNDFM